MTTEGMDGKMKERVYRGTVCIVADRHTFVLVKAQPSHNELQPLQTRCFLGEGYGRVRSLSLRLRQSRLGGSKDMTRPEKEMKKSNPPEG